MNEPLWLKKLLVFSLPVIVVLFYFTASSHFNYTPDDTYFTVRCATNLVNGNGVSFNPGQPANGIANPLWMFIVALGIRMGVDPLIAAKAMDLVLASLGLIAFNLLAYEIIRDVATALCATIAFSINAWFLRWSGTGMEASLSILLLLVTVWYCLRNQYVVATIFCALLTLVRQEAILLAVLIIGDLTINSNDKRRAIRRGGSLLLLYAVLIAPWFVYAKASSGTLIAGGVHSGAGSSLRIDDAALTLNEITKALFASDGAIIVIFLIAGAVLFWKFNKVRSHAPGEEIPRLYIFRQSFVALSWVVLVPTLYLITGFNAGSRDLLLLTPVVTMFSFWFLQRLFAESRWKRFAYSAIFLFTALVMLQNQYIYRRYIYPGIETIEQGMEISLIPIGKWLKENTPPGSIVFAPDPGAIGFYSDRPICDGEGIASLKTASGQPAVIPGNDDTHDALNAEEAYRSCGAQYVIDRSLEPERWKDEPDLIALFAKPFYQISFSEPKMYYYTLYKVR